MLYSITNPSDPYTIEAHSLDVAVAASMFLGQGQYQFVPLEEGAELIPFFAFGGIEEWFQKHFSRSAKEVVDQVVAEKRAELVECLDSCLIGKENDRELFHDAMKNITDPQERYDYWFKYHDKRRSSFNDIGGRAKKMAASFRAGVTKSTETVPVSVFVR